MPISPINYPTAWSSFSSSSYQQTSSSPAAMRQTVAAPTLPGNITQDDKDMIRDILSLDGAVITSRDGSTTRTYTDRTFGGGAGVVAVGVVDSSETRTRTATNTDGTKVSVQYTGTDGENLYSLQLGNSLTLEFSGDLRVGKSGDGNYLVYSSATGKTTHYNADGTIAEESDGDATAATAHKIHIGTTDTELIGGDEDELFFVLGDNTLVHCGSGNDTVVLGAYSYGAEVFLGEGSNSVSGGTAFDARISSGDGNNRIDISHTYDTDITLGAGNNIVKSSKTFGGSIVVGDGDNYIQATDAKATNILLGNGDNKFFGSLEYNSSFTAGNGNNHVDIEDVGTSYLDLYLAAKRQGYDVQGAWQPGHDRDDIKSIYTTWQGNTSITLGDGNNYLSMYDCYEATVYVGNGDNRVSSANIQSSNIHAGDGSNIVSLDGLDGSTTAVIGNGNNSIRIGGMQDNSSLSIGNGHNAIAFGSARDNATVSVGSGNNDIKIWALYDNALFSIENGNNIIEVNHLVGNSLLNIGDGKNTIACKTEWLGNIRTGSGKNSYKPSSTNHLTSMRTERLNSELPTIANYDTIFGNAAHRELDQRIRLLISKAF